VRDKIYIRSKNNVLDEDMENFLNIFRSVNFFPQIDKSILHSLVHFAAKLDCKFVLKRSYQYDNLRCNAC
jgi:hypothetical protein